MKTGLEKGIIRLLIAISCTWALLMSILISIGRADFRPPFLDTIEYPLAGYFLAVYYSRYWGQIIFLLLIPILSIWLIYYAINWIIAGFQNK